MARVFVYGTLKTGQPNYYRLERAMEQGLVRSLGAARTVDRFPLIIAGRYNIPYLLWARGTGHHLHGEVYEVDEGTLKQLDRLEEIPDHYQVEYIQVELLADSEQLTGVGHKRTECVTYVCKTFKPEMLNRPYYDNYDSSGSHGLPYSPVHSQVDQDYRYDVIERPGKLQ